MLIKVEARTRQGLLLQLPLDDVLNGYIVNSIEGLDPVKATMVTSSFANEDGEQYNSSRREARDVKIKVDLEPDYVTTTVANLRRRLYSFFMPKSEVFLRFVDTDIGEVDIVGRVEVCESALFTKEPAMDISVRCFGPDFVVPEPIVVSGMTTELDDETPIVYNGTIETGIVFTLELNRDETEFTIYNNSPDGVLRQLDFIAPLVADDTLHISTVTGNKGATLIRDDVSSSILYGVTPQSSWIELLPGTNNIRVYANGAAIPYEIEYVTRYGGL